MIENEDLKRRSERLNERINFLEEELYGQKVGVTGSGDIMESDPLLTEITGTLTTLRSKKETKAKRFKILKTEIFALNKEIKQQIEDSGEFVKKEDAMWNQIEANETELRN